MASSLSLRGSLPEISRCRRSPLAQRLGRGALTRCVHVNADAAGHGYAYIYRDNFQRRPPTLTPTP